ncbi:hypothetical protein [Aquiflexum gelatinilyticum]|uniref:Uncharacterized protein n=1 Tax=Aquiflexum gelatinilyticum TaxID=2961943 RepID=A0A9X2P908_9BACT|nr:hypothetical protein [Aquiflexum gelatinilyticum]MCR9016020.1 hypothetical protein [Aquiflexum gelatinilyticum]
MKEKIRGLFRRNNNEPKLLFYFSFFYFLFAIMYSVGDLKGDYPLILVISGILLHIIAFLVWSEKNSVRFKNDSLRRPKYFKKHRVPVYKILPIGLMLTYISSILYDFSRTDYNGLSIFSIIILFLTAMPMIIYFSILGGYFSRKLLNVFWIKIPIVNYIYCIIVVILIVMESK